MSIEEYFLRQPDNMPPKTNRKSCKTDTSDGSSQTSVDEQLAPEGNASTLDPALRQAIQEITANISKVIDEKLCLLSQMLQSHAQELKNLEKRTCEAETRITEVETGGDRAHLRIQALEQQVRSMSEHTDELENGGRRKNIRIISLPEGTEGGQSTIFFTSWLPRFLEMKRITILKFCTLITLLFSD